MRRADKLAKANHRRVAQRRDGRHLQVIESLETFLPGVRAMSERVQVIGEQDGGGLADPGDPGHVPGIVEWQHEEAFATARGARTGASARRLRGGVADPDQQQTHRE